jgi:hypothetical protein
MREFAINLLYYLSQADSGVARTIALQVIIHQIAYPTNPNQFSPDLEFSE